MIIRLVWVGKTKEPWAREAIGKYSKLIRPYAKIEVVEVKELKGRGPAERERTVESEGRRILEKAKSYVLLDVLGKAPGSVEFSDMLRARASMEFVIGGPWGVSDAVRGKADGILSLSNMTLTHDLARIVLMEQIYRGFTIITGKGYHH